MRWRRILVIVIGLLVFPPIAGVGISLLPLIRTAGSRASKMR